MGEIRQYFEDLRRDIKSKHEVASVKIGNAERSHSQFESRTYRVFIKSDYQDDLERIKTEIETNLNVDAFVTDSTHNHHILVSDAYDSKV